MEETMAARYWCHICSQIVNPVMESDRKAKRLAHLLFVQGFVQA